MGHCLKHMPHNETVEKGQFLDFSKNVIFENQRLTSSDFWDFGFFDSLNSRMHLLKRATHDQIPLLAMGVGRSDASDGRVFPDVFTAPTTHRSQNTAQIRFIGQRTGGMDKLKGLKIAYVYRDDGYGRETLPILDAQAAQYGLTVQHLAVKPPGLDQQVTWLRVKVAQSDWVILRTTDVMTTTALKEAAQVGFPRDKIVGASPTCTEQEVVPTGEAAMGFICATWHGTGTHFPLQRRT
jgi:branched-chain amino acid transport system substrate-binding protein